MYLQSLYYFGLSKVNIIKKHGSMEWITAEFPLVRFKTETKIIWRISAHCKIKNIPTIYCVIWWMASSKFIIQTGLTCIIQCVNIICKSFIQYYEIKEYIYVRILSLLELTEDFVVRLIVTKYRSVYTFLSVTLITLLSYSLSKL
jgi:5-bromo-4-chloroindolyl phosphate hydrolysis protein